MNFSVFELLSKHHFSKLDIHYRILKARASLPKKCGGCLVNSMPPFQVFVIIQHQHPKKTPVTAKKNRFMMILYSSAPEPHINIFWILHAIKKWQMNAKRVTILNCCVGVYFSISSNLLSRSWKKHYEKKVSWEYLWSNHNKLDFLGYFKKYFNLKLFC